MPKTSRLPRWLGSVDRVIVAMRLLSIPGRKTGEEGDPVLREFPVRVPHGVWFFRQLYDVSGDPAVSCVPDRGGKRMR